MRKTTNNKSWTINNEGLVVFHGRDIMTEQRYRPESGWEHPVMSFLVMFVCASLDFIMFKQLFASFLYDKPWIQWVALTGLLIGFDVAPIYLGRSTKKRSQGLGRNKAVAVVMGCAFALAAAAYFSLRIVMKDQVLPNLQEMTTSIFGDVSLGIPVNKFALPYALFSGVLPFVTSLVSFGISFDTANPRNQRLMRLECDQHNLEREMDQIQAALAEYRESGNLQERLSREDDAQYQSAKKMIQEQACEYADYVRIKIMEKLKTPAAANALSKDRRDKIMCLLREPHSPEAQAGRDHQSVRIHDMESGRRSYGERRA